MCYNICTPNSQMALGQLRFNRIALKLTLSPILACMSLVRIWRSCNWQSVWGLFISIKGTPTMTGSGNRLPPGDRNLRNEMFVQGQLWCVDCEQFLPIVAFWKGKGKQSSNYGYRFYCKECDKARRNKRVANKYQNTRNQAIKCEAVILMGKRCQRCGYESAPAMDFHHVYPEEKEYTPTTLLYRVGVAEAWKELDKCCMLCRNCHVEYRARVWRAEFIRRDKLGWTVGNDLPLDDNRYEAKEVPDYKQALLPEAYCPKKPLQLAMGI